MWIICAKMTLELQLATPTQPTKPRTSVINWTTSSEILLLQILVNTLLFKIQLRIGLTSGHSTTLGSKHSSKTIHLTQKVSFTLAVWVLNHSTLMIRDSKPLSTPILFNLLLALQSFNGMPPTDKAKAILFLYKDGLSNSYSSIQLLILL